jgi:hypothetical protein
MSQVQQGGMDARTAREYWLILVVRVMNRQIVVLRARELSLWQSYNDLLQRYTQQTIDFHERYEELKSAVP